MNLAFLMWVALIPWPTSVLAECMRSGGAGERVAACVYAGTMTVMGASFGALWVAIVRRTHVSVGHAQIRRFVVGAPIYALSIAMALVSAPACRFVNARLAVFYAVPSGARSRMPPRAAAADVPACQRLLAPLRTAASDESRHRCVSCVDVLDPGR